MLEAMHGRAPCKVVLTHIKFNHDPLSLGADAMNIRVDGLHDVSVPEWKSGYAAPGQSSAAYAIAESGAMSGRWRRTRRRRRSLASPPNVGGRSRRSGRYSPRCHRPPSAAGYQLPRRGRIGKYGEYTAAALVFPRRPAARERESVCAGDQHRKSLRKRRVRYRHNTHSPRFRLRTAALARHGGRGVDVVFDGIGLAVATEITRYRR
jgi:hypothetical protein